MAKIKADSMMCCSLCSYRTRSPSYLKRHQLTHEETRRSVCNECGSRFKTTSALNLHVREKHNSSAHVCQTCGLEFTHRRALDRHTLCHSDEMHFGCSLCGYRCRRKQDLDRHVRAMHSGKVRRKRHEESLAIFFSTLQVPFTREFTVKAATFGGRSFARIDFLIQMAWGWLLVECDEMQHCMYSISDECRRMAAIREYHRQRFPDDCLHILRYNSHNYKQDGVVKKPSEQERMARVQACLSYVPESDFVITYLFYRLAEGVPAVTLHPEFSLREYVRTA